MNSTKHVAIIAIVCLASSCGAMKEVNAPAPKIGPPITSESSLKILTLNTQLKSPGMYCVEGVTVEESPIGDFLTGGSSSKAAEDIATVISWAEFLVGHGLGELIPFEECVSQRADQAPDDAKVIADDILKLDLDVISLNEVFDDDAKSILVDKLKFKYPYYIRKFNKGSALEDSGLMIFSRFPLQKLPHQPSSWPTSNPNAPELKYFANAEGSSSYTAFALYETCFGPDCHADKGAAVVHIKPDGKTSYYVVVTHFQADSGYHHVRQAQMNDIASMLTAVIGESLPDENVVIAGDLNIMGQGAVWDPKNDKIIKQPEFSDADKKKLLKSAWYTSLESVPEHITSQPLQSTGYPPPFDQVRFGESEWAEFEKRLNNFSENRGTYADAWASYMPIEDLGITQSLGTRRYDYGLVSRNIRETGCMQHMRTIRIGNSDHLGVFMDINRRAKFCHPRDAHLEPVTVGRLGLPIKKKKPILERIDALEPNGPDVTKIAFPGSMQWFRVMLQKTQTVSIGVESPFDKLTGEGVAFAIYSPYDISNPIPPQPGTKHHDIELDMDVVSYRMPEEFYVRVFSPNPNWTGNYTLGIHEHLCASAEDACILHANHPEQFDIFEPSKPLNAEDAAWFRIDVTDVPDSETAQPLKFFLQGAFDLEFVDSKDPTKPAALNNVGVTKNGLLNFVETKETGKPSIFMKARRTINTTGYIKTVGWESPLMRIHGSKLVPMAGAYVLECRDETNPELGSDEIELQVDIDGAGWTTILSKSYECNSGGLTYPINKVVRFLNNSKIRIVEGDDISDNDTSKEFYLPGLGTDFDFVAEWKKKPGYQDITYKTVPFVVNRNHGFWWNTGTYFIYYSLSPQQPACDGTSSADSPMGSC